MPALISRPKRGRIIKTTDCPTCCAPANAPCWEEPRGGAFRLLANPHPARIKAYEAAHPKGGNRGTSIRTVPVDLGDQHPAYRALDDDSKQRVRNKGAAAMRAELADIANGRR